jgi:Dockerin type I domain
MLTAGPRVVAVEVASTSWTPEFVSYFQDSLHLDRKGYDIPLGSSAQSDTLTWTNLDQIRIKFNTGVILNSADLSISGVNHTAYAFSAFRYDPQTRWATWTLSTPLVSDRLQLDLDGNGARPVRDYGANALDGEWTNNSSTVSGNGTAGGDFEFKLNVQPADVNNSSSVSLSDQVAILAHVGQSTTSSGYSAKYDIDGNGTIDASDALAAVDRVFQTLPTGSPAGVNNDAPTTSLFSFYQIGDASSSLALGLTYGFADAESGSNGLTYSIVSNDRPDLFSAASINSTTKQLVVNAASGASGRATIVVRATDPSGLFADTPVKVDVNYTNVAPTVVQFHSYAAGPGTRLYWGTVADPDDNLSDLVVYVYGDFFETVCAVDEEGNFQFAVLLDDEAIGLEFAFAIDLNNVPSDEVYDPVGNT